MSPFFLSLSFSPLHFLRTGWQTGRQAQRTALLDKKGTMIRHGRQGLGRAGILLFIVLVFFPLFLLLRVKESSLTLSENNYGSLKFVELSRSHL